ncbi:MAG: succinylglutamate desuccinylase/aspartoacylase family protein [Rhodospirillales bacterium]|nr:succinylglutamate desuccinylase/aspartoacylase family protein [Rhodospirillales bacterium]
MPMTPLDETLLAQPPLPQFDVQLQPPDLAPWREGNCGVAGFTTRAAATSGPHVALVALMHGNELAGAIVLDRLLRGGLRPRRGRLTFGFANLAAFDSFDPAQPTVSRFLDEDMNRLWDPVLLDGPRRSIELDRARQMRPLVETADVLLDLHSMLWASDPLLLSGGTAKGRRLAAAIGQPELVVADPGHVSGRRLIDYGAFADPDAAPAAVLVEAGQHWEPATVAMTLASVAGLLRHLDMVAAHPALLPSPLPPQTPRFAEVTQVVTAATASFAFVQPFRGGDVVRERGTLIAIDGSARIRTPHDHCLLVMPSLRPSRGHTAVRLARFLAA